MFYHYLSFRCIIINLKFLFQLSLFILLIYQSFHFIIVVGAFISFKFVNLIFFGIILKLISLVPQKKSHLSPLFTQ